MGWPTLNSKALGGVVLFIDLAAFAMGAITACMTATVEANTGEASNKAVCHLKKAKGVLGTRSWATSIKDKKPVITTRREPLPPRTRFPPLLPKTHIDLPRMILNPSHTRRHLTTTEPLA